MTDPSHGWRAFHLVYHGDRDRLLRELVHPLAGSLRASGSVERFFFIRYNLGGPHVRLRVLAGPGRDAEVEDEVRTAAAAFFARAPSTATLPDAEVHLRNRGIIHGDPLADERDDVVLPDNSLHPAPPGFEVDRYGGAPRFAHTLEAFEASSVDALAWLAATPAPTPAARLGEAWAAAVRHAWAGAEEGDEFLRLLAIPVPAAPSPLAPFAARGDEAYERGAEGMQARMRGELERLAGGGDAGGPAPRWALGPQRLAHAVADADEVTRRRIMGSHAHMAANRLGLSMPEEGYLGRMLWRTAQAVAASAPELWRDVWNARRTMRHAGADMDAAFAAIRAT